jgi:hypothetical protein
MKTILKFGLLVAITITVIGCATFSSIGGSADRHGLISQASVVADGQLVASYSVILGLVDSGYGDYAAAVKQAEAQGKTVTTVTTDFLGFFTSIKAYAK